jgi:hypothetical protein
VKRLPGLGYNLHMDITRATHVDQETEKVIEDMFTYHAWDAKQQASGALIREALAHAFAVIIANAPPCPDRSAALRKLRECRMDANSAISHAGKY